jgi:Spy/CpxP family protein refolding chaperone
MSAHRRRAQRIGAELVAAEKDLDALFAERVAGTASVDQATQKVAVLQGQLRAEHLKTHLLANAILTPAQVEQYSRLRGYGLTPGTPVNGDAAPAPVHKHH